MSCPGNIVSLAHGSRTSRRGRAITAVMVVWYRKSDVIRIATWSWQEARTGASEGREEGTGLGSAAPCPGRRVGRGDSPGSFKNPSYGDRSRAPARGPPAAFFNPPGRVVERRKSRENSGVKN